MNNPGIRAKLGIVELTQELLARIAGWEVVKQARDLLATGKVRASDWSPPVLSGLVQEGTRTYRARLVIHDAIDVENRCPCRASQSQGVVCAHAVAAGLHYLRIRQPLPPASAKAGGGDAAPAGPARAPSKGGSAPASPKKSVRTLLRAAEGEPGEPVEVFVILPPNLAQAVAKSALMLVFEASWRQGRCPLNALPATVPFELTEPDLRLLDAVEAFTAGEAPAMLMLRGTELGRVLPALAGHPRVTVGKSQRVRITSDPYRLRVQAALAPSGEINLRVQGTLPASILSTGDAAWVFSPELVQPLGLPAECRELVRGPVELSRERVPGFLTGAWLELTANCEVSANFRLEDFRLEPRPPRFELHLAGGLAHLRATLQGRYGDRVLAPGQNAAQEAVWLPDPATPTRYFARDTRAEQGAQARLYRAGFTGPHAEGHYQLAGQEKVLSFFAREYPRLQREWQVTLEERLEGVTAKTFERIEPAVRITPSGEQWFDLEVRFVSNAGARLPSSEIQRLLLSGSSHTRLPNGRIALLDTAAVEEFQEVLRDCDPHQDRERYRMANTQAGFLEATLREQPGWRVESPVQWRERAARQSGEASLECPPLGELEGVLRPYQKQGVAWLWFLRQNGFGGILADEMGLGKTLQTLACIQAAVDRRGDGAGGTASERQPTLIVCPTSLVYNWRAEAERFTPRLRALVWHGPQREASLAQIGESDIVVTSYALLRRDAARFQEVAFDTVVLDEAQHIKNRQTQNAQAVKAVRARHRLVLTGTPLENSVLDLWSIFDFLMPGYLGAAPDFRERYELPITRDRDEATQSRLARRLRPFLLRRLKRDVAADLPARLEQVLFCELTDDQARVYRDVLEASRREVLEAVDKNGLARSRMVVLTALLRLRQVCCDLRLLGLEKVDPATASSKLDLFTELLEEALDGGHRVLVFSQFVRMLALLREEIERAGLSYCYLDGSTVDRAAVVERFQNEPGVAVFLISLKAGGVGLNLTGADTVVHFDPWWNPAVEAQATDRAHRIGQERTVTSYKLITRGTVEEKILRLQGRKQELLAAMLGGEGAAETLRWEEIQELFAEGVRA